MRHTVAFELAKESRWNTWRLCSLLLLVFCSLPAPVRSAETIVAFGDSTTAPRNVGMASNGRPVGLSSYGLNQSDAGNPPHNTVLQVDETDGHLYVYSDVLRDLLADSLFDLEAVDNEGIGGNRTDQALSRLDSDVRAKDPEVVIIQYGINDSWVDSGVSTDPSRTPLDFLDQTGGDGILGNGNDHVNTSLGNYEDNLSSIVQTLKADGVEVIIMTPSPVSNTVYPSWLIDREALYAQAARDVATAESVDLVDIWQLYMDYDALPGQGLDDLLVDSQHPGALGHHMTADALFDLINTPNGIVGDVNQNGVVLGDGTQSAEVDDVTAFIEGWLTTGHVGKLEMYTHGDMNFDGITDLADAFILHGALQAAGASGLNFGLLTVVPEPATFALVFTGLLMTVMGRGRRGWHVALESIVGFPTRQKLATKQLPATPFEGETLGLGTI